MTHLCAIIFVFGNLNLLPIAAGNKTLAIAVESKPFLRQIAPNSERSAVVGNKDRYSRSASTLIPSISAAASTTSAAQVSRRNNDLWYLEQSVVSYMEFLKTLFLFFDSPDHQCRTNLGMKSVIHMVMNSTEKKQVMGGQ